MKCQLILAAFVFVNLSGFIGYGQILELDLASIKPGEVKVLLENKNASYTTIHLLNSVPAGKYSLSYEIVRELLDPLSVEGLRNENDLDLCEDLVKELKLVKENSGLKEDEVSSTIDRIKLLVKKCEEAAEDLSVTDKRKKIMQEYINAVNIELNKIFRREISLNITVSTGETVKIFVSRDNMVWTFILRGRQAGQWITTYGFSFTTQNFERPIYFTEQISGSTTYKLTQAGTAKILDLNFVPAVFFSYFPSQNFNSSWNHSLTAGLGVDLAAPVVFFGYSALHYNNIGLSAGVAFHQQYRLKSQYNETSEFSMALDKDQLHDKIYRPNFFISVNFRFGESPFGSNNKSDEVVGE